MACAARMLVGCTVFAFGRRRVVVAEGIYGIHSAFFANCANKHEKLMLNKVKVCVQSAMEVRLDDKEGRREEWQHLLTSDSAADS
jgi:hypothetical protein